MKGKKTNVAADEEPIVLRILKINSQFQCLQTLIGALNQHSIYQRQCIANYQIIMNCLERTYTSTDKLLIDLVNGDFLK